MRIKIINIAVAIVASTSLMGCASLYSTYQRPKENIEVDSLYQYIEATNDTTNIASLSWRELFSDPQLQSLIEMGLESNSSLNVARLNIEQAKIALKTARLSYLPTISATPQAGVSDFNNTTTQTYNISMSASWEIDVFGRVRNAKERSRMAFEQSKAYEQAVHTGLVATIANSYYSLLLLDRQLDISIQTKKNWEDNLRVMKVLKEAGKANQISVQQAEANAHSLNANIVTIKEQIAELENSLSALLGVTPQQIERGDIDYVEFPSELSVGVPLQLLSNRPDVRVAEYALAQMFYGVNEARSSLYPKLTLGGSVGFTNGNSGIVNPGDWLFNATASLMQPIFNQGKLRGELKISKLEYDKALIAFSQALLDAGAEVNSSLINWQSARERLAYDAQRVESLSGAIKSSELLMKSGSANYLEVLVAQNSLLQAQLTQSADKYSEIQGVIELYRSLGGGV